MQTVIPGASQLKVTRSRMPPGSSAGTGDRWTSRLPVEAVQPPYHLFRRGIEAGLLPYAAAHHIGVLACGRWPAGCSAAPSPKPPRSAPATGGRTARRSPGPGSGAISKSSRR